MHQCITADIPPAFFFICDNALSLSVPFSILTHSVIVSYCSLLGSAVLCNCHLAWENFKHATAQASICLHLKHFLWSRIQDVSSFAIGTGAVKDELFTLLTCATPWERGLQSLNDRGTKTSYLKRLQQHYICSHLNTATLYIWALHIHLPIVLLRSLLGGLRKFWATVSVMFEGFECNINIESQEKGLMQCFYSRNTFHHLFVCYAFPESFWQKLNLMSNMKSKTISDPYTEINAVLLDYFNCYVFNVILRLLFPNTWNLKE